MESTAYRRVPVHMGHVTRLMGHVCVILVGRYLSAVLVLDCGLFYVEVVCDREVNVIQAVQLERLALIVWR